MEQLITCGVTSFNARSSIESAVLSVLAQDYRPIEIVVVDDCSTDGTPAIVARLAAQHHEVRVFRQERNCGVAASRNRVIREARGELIAFFDDDDESHPERLARQLRRILDYERDFAAGAPVICHTARQIRFPGGEAQIWRALGELEGVSAPAGPLVARAVLAAGPPPTSAQGGAAATCSQMARRSVYVDLGSFDPEFRRSEDDDLVVRAALAGTHFVGVAMPLVYQTLTPSSDKSFATQHRYGMQLLEKHRGFLEADGSYRFARRYYEARYALMAGRYWDFATHMAAAIVLRPRLASQRLSVAVGTLGLSRRMGDFYVKIGKPH